MTQLTLANLCVTSGPVTEPEPGLLRIGEPITRARALIGHPDAARLEFLYHGPTDRQVPGRSDTYRQIGLQLRTPNPCNGLYVTWRLLPAEELVVQTKWNPELTGGCGGIGYEPVARTRLPAYRPGEWHRLAARLSATEDDGYEVVCWIDGGEFLRAAVDPGRLAAADGCRTGIRSDNGVYSVRYFVESESG